MRRIGEVREKIIEVGVEIAEFAQPGEAFADALAPPFSLQGPELSGIVARTKG